MYKSLLFYGTFGARSYLIAGVVCVWAPAAARGGYGYPPASAWGSWAVVE